MTEQEFQALARQGYTSIPIMREVLADLDTPLSTYLKLANGPYSYLFESVHGGEKWGRYSIIGLPCERVIRIYDKTIKIFIDNQLSEQVEVEDPLAWIEDYQATFKHPQLEAMPKFTGGLVGYFGYETIRYIEPKLAKTPVKHDPLQLPDILLMVSEQVIVFDNLSGKLYIIVHANPDNKDAYAKAESRIDQLINKMHQALPKPQIGKSRQVNEADFISGFTQKGFEQAVDKIKQYITDGDAMQVVISQRMSI
ncbi:MAG: anthranilate synthase component I, partial [Thioalkalispiraceae bacterium]